MIQGLWLLITKNYFFLFLTISPNFIPNLFLIHSFFNSISENHFHNDVGHSGC